MKERRTMGQLVIGSSAAGRCPGSLRTRARKRKTRLRAVAMVVAVGIVTILLYGAQALAAQITPKRMVLRGCWLTEVQDVLDALQYSSDQSIATIRRRCAGLDTSSLRWLRSVTTHQVYPYTALLIVRERYPLLLLATGSADYWLCDDGWVVPTDGTNDCGEPFARIRQLPRVRVEYLQVDKTLPEADALLLAAACCTEVLPGVIDMIEIDAAGELNVYDQHGFRIYLGTLESLPAKIGALPKALRICEESRNQLEFLDASNPHVFYEKWQEPIS